MLIAASGLPISSFKGEISFVLKDSESNMAPFIQPLKLWHPGSDGHEKYTCTVLATKTRLLTLKSNIFPLKQSKTKLNILIFFLVKSSYIFW